MAADDSMDSETRARMVIAAATRAMLGAQPAPVELCEELHAAVMAAYNVLGKALYKFESRVDRADVRNQRTRLKALARQLESHHMRPRVARFAQRGDT
jgi:hypothetical protein